MAKTARKLIVGWWDQAWDEGLWAASWRKSLEGLTPRQAAWRPAGVKGQRHSIWQLVLHMVFWREVWLRRAETGEGPMKDELRRLNFPEITDTSKAAWGEAVARFEQSQKRIARALRTLGPKGDPIMNFLPHDCYHFGQVNMLRGMQGLTPIE